MTVAVISGTTSGLGREFVDAVMGECPEIDEIWMIARRQDRLESIAAEYPRMRFVCLPFDLSQDDGYAGLEKELEARKPDIGVVVANAGVASAGLVEESEPDALERMIRLNAIGSTMLIRLCLPYMRRGSFVIQVSSVSAFAPNPNLTVYSATKAYASFFAAGLREELKPRGINVLRLNPGNMRTGMQCGPWQHRRQAAVRRHGQVRPHRVAQSPRRLRLIHHASGVQGVPGARQTGADATADAILMGLTAIGLSERTVRRLRERIGWNHEGG